MSVRFGWLIRWLDGLSDKFLKRAKFYTYMRQSEHLLIYVCMYTITKKRHNNTISGYRPGPPRPSRSLGLHHGPLTGGEGPLDQSRDQLRNN